MAERDFNLEMTGEQVKDALQQLEDRVAEGWAVGEKDGTPVTSGSPYYENNAKYYAEQAGLSATAAADSAATAEQEVEEGIRQGIVGTYVQESATPGAIVTIDDGADDVPLKDLKVNLAINQPGTGDPSPSNVRPIYPVTEAEVSVLGTNMWNPANDIVGRIGTAGGYINNPDFRTSDYIRISPNTAYYFRNVINWNNGGCAIYYNANKEFIYYQSIRRGASNVPVSEVLTSPANAAYVRLVRYATATEFGLNYPSTDTAYHAYAGSTTLVDIGINQWDEQTEQGYIGNDGTLGSDASSIRSANYCACIGGTQYCVVAPASRAIHWYDKDKTHLSYDGIGAPSTVVTAPANAAYFKLSAYLQGYPYANNMSVNYPARFNTYKAYTGNVVYGGELDVTTGVLTARYASVDLGSLSWSYANATFYTGGVSSSAKANGASKCSIYKSSSSGADKTIFIGSGAVVYAYDADYTSAASFKTAMSGVQLVYELATPISIQLSPTEVDTLRGDNVIFCDAGDITNCEYRADLKMYIDKVVGA